MLVIAGAITGAPGLRFIAGQHCASSKLTSNRRLNSGQLLLRVLL
jgi:hypothetical protein